MIFDKLKELVLKNKIFCICFVANVICFCMLFVSLVKMSSLKNYYKNELGLCVSLLESVYAQQDNRMEKIMKNLENNMEKADALYNNVVNNLK